MRVLHVGTDEAGYGPLLGPLVIAAAVYETDAPRSSLPSDGIADSKVVYARGGRDALGRVLGRYLDLAVPLRLSELLARHSVRGDPRPDYAWYGDVRDAAASAGSPPPGFRRIWINPVCEREFNEGCRAWGGKAGLLFRETMRVVRRALDGAPGLDAEVVCDRHGGRRRYAALLLAEFEPSALVTESETPACSSYRLTVGSRALKIRFMRRGESSDTLVALASMAAKYVRELFMEALNAYFAARVKDLRPTAGYYADGRRFLEQVSHVLADLAAGGENFVRHR